MNKKLLKKLVLVVVIVIIIIIVFILKIDDIKINYLWNNTVKISLQDKCWEKEHAYNAGSTLQIPLHYAFTEGDIEKQKQFKKQFKEFDIDKYIKEYKINQLDKLQYMYLVSRYLVLECNEKSNNNVQLANKMMKLIYKMWDNPIDNWNLVGLKNMGKSIEWKIHNKEVERSYYRAITDIELYVLAISCDLQYYFKINGNIDNENKLKYITKYVNYIFDSEIKYVDDKIWYFQADVWSEHPDYLYATYDEIKEHLKPIPVKNIVMDSSHYSRFPLWLVSFREIQDEEYRKKYSKLLDDLSHTFISKVLVVPTDDFKLYRTKNYMNGINGLFRYNYMNKGNNYAHKPYSLGTFYLGWWKFTDTKEIDNIYKSISKISFPMSLKYRNSYTTFDKNNYENFVKGSMVYPYVLNNGYAELISLLKYNNK